MLFSQACEGYPVDLTAVAVDDNGNEDVRIYIEDRDVDLELYTVGTQPYKIDGGIDNSDFFHANLSSAYTTY
jgi:hypothetical protein